MLKNYVAYLLAALTLGQPAGACGFHNYVPQETLVDRLLGSDQFVFARSWPENPFQYKTVETIGNVAEPNLPHLVDSITRRKLALDANATVLFARDVEDGSWQRLAFVDSTLEPVLRTVLARLPAWEMGPDTDRLMYFASLLSHHDTGLYELALRELDLASYEQLRGLPLDIDISRVRARLDDPTEWELKPIRIFLLGLSDVQELRPQLKEGLERSVQAESVELGAFATAFIELSGPDAVAHIAATYLINPTLPLSTREGLVEAFAMHIMSGSPMLQKAIAKHLETAVWVDPRLAGAVARQFGARGNWSQQAILHAAVQEGGLFSPADQQDIAQYLSVQPSSKP